MNTNGRTTSPQMERIIQQLAVDHGVDLSLKKAQFILAMPNRADQWMITNLDGERISVTRCVVEDGNCLGLVLDMVFARQAEGWEPVELVHTTTLWQEYRQAAKASGIPIYQDNGDTCFATFTEYWATQIQQQGWLTQAGKVDQAEVEWTSEPSGRIPGCQSTHRGDCYGQLWQCAECGKTVCFAEGSDNHPELCDVCWCNRYATLEDDVPF